MKKIALFLLLSLIIISGCKQEVQEPEGPCVNITTLDLDFKLEDYEVPEGTWEEKECPSGKKVVYIDLIKTEDNSRWRKALYCEDEDYFYIADFRPPGMNVNRLKWYGVYEGKPCSIDQF